MTATTPCKLLTFVTTLSRASRSNVSNTWSSNLNMIDSTISKYCACHRFGVRCTIYCHRRTGECPNEATSSVYTQVAIMNVPKHEDEELEEELEEQL